jgi:hypothetical protein
MNTRISAEKGLSKNFALRQVDLFSALIYSFTKGLELNPRAILCER